MSTPAIPATPELTIANSQAELRAALEAQTAPEPIAPPATPDGAVPPPPAPPAAEPYTISETPEGVEIKLETGAVYKGKTWQDAAASLIRGKVEADKTLHQLKAAQPAPATTPTVPAEDPNEAATRRWVVEQVAKEFGLPVETLKQRFGEIIENSQKTAVNVAWTDFVQSCPDYADTAENAAALVDYLPQEVLSQSRPPTPQELKYAHAAALYDKKYAPAPTSQGAASQPPRPPAMPTASAGQSASEPNPWTMPLNELRNKALNQ